MPINISDLIDSFLKHEKRDKKPNVVYASEIAYCLRKLYYKQKQPVDFDKDTLRILHMGNLIHNFLSWVLVKCQEDSGYKFIKSEKQIAVVDGLTDVIISGRVDDVCLVEKDNELIAIEGKSTKSLAYIKEPMMHHVWQLMVYLKALNLKRGIIVYLEKNTLQTKQFEVKFDSKIFNQILEKARKYYEHTSTDKLPEKQPTADWECKLCEYKDICNS